MELMDDLASLTLEYLAVVAWDGTSCLVVTVLEDLWRVLDVIVKEDQEGT